MSTVTTAAATESTVEVVYATDADDLYRVYRGQSSPQPVYVTLTCTDGGTLEVGYASGGGTPVDVYHRRALRWSVPCLTVDAANALLDQLAPLAQRVVDGYDTRFDGHNRVGVYSADATDAADAISDLCSRDWREHEVQRRWEAGDYYASISRRELLDATGISAETTDEQLAALVADEEGRALADGVTVDGVEGYLAQLRDELREEAEEAAAAEADEDEDDDDEQGGTYALVDGEQVELLDEGTCPCCVGSIRWGQMAVRGNRVEEGRCDCADWRREERGDEWAYTATSRDSGADAEAEAEAEAAAALLAEHDRIGLPRDRAVQLREERGGYLLRSGTGDRWLVLDEPDAAAGYRDAGAYGTEAWGASEEAWEAAEWDESRLPGYLADR